MTPPFVIDPASAIPVFEQIRSHYAGAIAEGRLSPGDRLPAARELAADLGVAVATVSRAFRELTDAGLTTSQRRFGTAVAAGAVPPVPADVRAAAARLAVRAKAAGLRSDAVIDLLRATMRDDAAGDG